MGFLPALTQFCAYLLPQMSRQETLPLTCVLGVINAFHWAVHCRLFFTFDVKLALTLFAVAFYDNIICRLGSLKHECAWTFDLFLNKLIKNMSPDARSQNCILPFFISGTLVLVFHLFGYREPDSDDSVSLFPGSLV